MPRLIRPRRKGLTVAFFSLAMASYAHRAPRLPGAGSLREASTPHARDSRPRHGTAAPFVHWQGRRELNSQPLVLETSALPIELHPCNWVARPVPRGAHVVSCDAPRRRDHLLLAWAPSPSSSHLYYARIFVTTPEPTVRPPSRMAKRTPSSIAIGVISSTLSLALSPGMHISASPT